MIHVVNLPCTEEAKRSRNQNILISSAQYQFISILRLIFRIWTEDNCLVLFTSSLDDRKGTRPPREASLQFSEDVNFVSLTCIAVIKCLR
jgi:hypothetical protein